MFIVSAEDPSAKASTTDDKDTSGKSTKESKGEKGKAGGKKGNKKSSDAKAKKIPSKAAGNVSTTADALGIITTMKMITLKDQTAIPMLGKYKEVGKFSMLEYRI